MQKSNLKSVDTYSKSKSNAFAGLVFVLILLGAALITAWLS